MRERTAVRAGRIAALILLAACGGRPRVVAVDIRQMAFVPDTVHARPGDTLVFTNHDFVPHTATARDSAWDSGEIAADKSWRMEVKKPGPFYCRFHPNMTGVIARD